MMDEGIFNLSLSSHPSLSLLSSQGVLVFFSSYSIMNSCIDKWKDKGVAALSIWDRIRRRKEIVIEPKNKVDRLRETVISRSITDGTGSSSIHIRKCDHH